MARHLETKYASKYAFPEKTSAHCKAKFSSVTNVYISVKNWDRCQISRQSIVRKSFLQDRKEQHMVTLDIWLLVALSLAAVLVGMMLGMAMVRSFRT